MAQLEVEEMAERMGKRMDPSPDSAVFLPEPEPRHQEFTIISVDDHVIEAPDMFNGRLPNKYVEFAPRVVEEANGSQVWSFDDKVNREIGLGAVVGRPPMLYNLQPTRFEHMRPGCWQPKSRVQDMDLAAISSMLMFPNALPGFCGTRFCDAKDPDLGLALIRAWNTWIMEEWVEPYPSRFIPCQLTWMNDAVVAAAEVRANAERGFKAVSFSEAPHKLGRPSVHTGYWDPFIAACEETETVICLHTGSSSSIHMTADDAPLDEIPILFPISAMFAAVDWLYGEIPVRFPGVKIALSEGGIGWVPGLLDRLDHSARHRQYVPQHWSSDGLLTASDVLRRNFWFCALDDPAGFEIAHRIGIDHIMVESDYPHEDSTWPDTQMVLEKQFGDLSRDDIEKVTHENATALFRLDV
jgi:predicted TIM-barrel fold metal-dependent hydrolase